MRNIEKEIRTRGSAALHALGSLFLRDFILAAQYPFTPTGNIIREGVAKRKGKVVNFWGMNVLLSPEGEFTFPNTTAGDKIELTADLKTPHSKVLFKSS